MEQNFPLKADNLGNWLATRGWINPSLFNGMHNKDLMDGTQIQLKSTKLRKYLRSENGGGTIVVANSQSASEWETFKLRRLPDDCFGLRVYNNKFVGRDSTNNIVAVADTVQEWERFEILRQPGNPNRVRLKSTNGFFLQAKSEGVMAADYKEDLDWEDSNPTIFIMTILNDKTIHGEIQLTNDHGSASPQVLQDGTKIQLKSAKFQKFLCSENGGGTNVVANRQSAANWETFKLSVLEDGYFGLRVFNNKFMGRDSQNNIVAVVDWLQGWEKFEIVRQTSDPNRVRLKSTNGFFLQAISESVVKANYSGVLGWEDSNPTVFIMTVMNERIIRGEFQLTSGYDSIRAEALQDGTQIQLKSTKLQKYLCAENGGGTNIVVDRQLAADWETFKLSLLPDGYFGLRVNNNKFMGRDPLHMVSIVDWIKDWEKFEIVRHPSNPNRVRLKSTDGSFLQVISERVVAADYRGEQGLGWEDSNPSVFMMTILNDRTIQEFQQQTNRVAHVLQDGTQIQLKSTKLQKYLCSENGGGTNVVADRQSAADWETFKLSVLADGYFGLRVCNKYVGRDPINIVAKVDWIKDWEKFEIVRQPSNPNRIRLKSTNGFFLQVKSERVVAADYNGEQGLGWEDSNPSIFIMTVLKDRPAQVLQDGAQIQLKSMKFQRYLSSGNSGGIHVVANRHSAADRETFKLSVLLDGYFGFRAWDNKFVGRGPTNIVTEVYWIKDWEKFEIVRQPSNPNRIRLKSTNGYFLQVKSESVVAADYNGELGWEDSNPTVFQMTVLNEKSSHGEFRLSNGYLWFH